MIVTIDGPAGAGKSTVARMLAQQLGFLFLDTGAMYRCVVYLAMKQGIAWDDLDALGELARALPLKFEQDRVMLDREDVTDEIRSAEVTAAIFHAADNLQVRAALVSLQRELAQDIDVVTEGRDQGTVAFPHAKCKIYLSASPRQRAQRRLDQLKLTVPDLTLDQVMQQQALRDEQDMAREVGGLQAAEDALFLVTDGLTAREVVAEIERLVILRKTESDDDQEIPPGES
ncbi:MAG: (d)CMP kinase [Planctomycetota bacterium]|nr:(d)CMP kinase [Planctomycetota bacterium]